MRELGLPTPVETAVPVHWEKEETEKLLQMVKDGKSYEIIGKTLNRKTSAVRKKLKRMFSTEDIAAVQKILKEEEILKNKEERND